jgi:hypothetical protein
MVIRTRRSKRMLVRQKCGLTFALYIFLLAIVCFIAAHFCRVQGHPITGFFVSRHAVYFLLVSVLCAVLAIFKRL